MFEELKELEERKRYMNVLRHHIGTLKRQVKSQFPKTF